MAMRWAWTCLALASTLSAAPSDPSGRLVEETWETAVIDGVQVGFAHTTVHEVERPDGTRLRATWELDLTFRRQGSLLRLHIEQGTEETRQGRVVGVFLRQGQQGGPRLELTGSLEEGRMHVRVDGGRLERRLAWPDEVVGWYGREHLFAKRKPRPGDGFTFLRYEPTLNTVVTMQANVKGFEDVALPSGSRKLLRVDMRADCIELPGQSVQPPGAVWWLDENYLPVRRQFDLEGLGDVVLTRSTRAAAVAPPTPGRTVDVGVKTLVPLNRPIRRPYDTQSVVYRILLPEDPEPAKALANDSHQEARALGAQMVEVHVHPPQAPRALANAAPVAAEFLGTSHYLDCTDPRIGALARTAVGDETGPWRKARRIERWVKDSMRVDNSAPLVPAGQIARDLCGDCRHFALLTTAMCRAEGVPARTAVGLLYVEKGGRPYMGFHMWTEVYVGGTWLGLDATLGRGGVSAAHLKVADHSWHEVQSLTPLLPLQRILGKIRIEVLRVAGDG
jgi:transglutaminase-like putative cysteine protease